MEGLPEFLSINAVGEEHKLLLNLRAILWVLWAVESCPKEFQFTAWDWVLSPPATLVSLAQTASTVVLYYSQISFDLYDDVVHETRQL